MIRAGSGYALEGETQACTLFSLPPWLERRRGRGLGKHRPPGGGGGRQSSRRDRHTKEMTVGHSLCPTASKSIKHRGSLKNLLQISHFGQGKGRLEVLPGKPGAAWRAPSMAEAAGGAVTLTTRKRGQRCGKKSWPPSQSGCQIRWCRTSTHEPLRSGVHRGTASGPQNQTHPDIRP